MREAVRCLAVLAAMTPAMAAAAEPAPPPASASVQTPAHVAPAAGDFRLKRVTVPADPMLQIDAPQSMLRSGFGGSMVDLFPFAGSKFHFSGGGKLFGRAGRPRLTDPECMRSLPAFRGGSLRVGRRFSPAMLVGYGQTVERGLAFGLDAGVVMGKLGATPDRLGRFNRERLDSIDGRGRRSPMNQIARVTALYRF